MPEDPKAPDAARRYWAETKRLMVAVLVAWAALGLALPLLAAGLNRFALFGVPLGYFLAAQGSLAGFVVLVFWYAGRQNRIDEKFHVAED